MRTIGDGLVWHPGNEQTDQTNPSPLVPDGPNEPVPFGPYRLKKARAMAPGPTCVPIVAPTVWTGRSSSAT